MYTSINEWKKRLVKESKKETTKTIAQQLKVKDFPFIINDSKGNKIYKEYSNGYWTRYEYDSNGNEIYYEDSEGGRIKKEYDSNGNWIKSEYDSEDEIEDNRNINERKKPNKKRRNQRSIKRKHTR